MDRPDIDLVTQVKFSPERRFRADFAAGLNWQWKRKRNGMKERSLLLPPAVLIECQGGVHKIKFEADAQKEAEALRLGFKYYRVHWETLEEGIIPQIAADIKSVKGKES